MKIITFMRPDEKTQPPSWADRVIKLYINDVRSALLSVFGYNEDILLLRNNVKITDKVVIIKFFSSLKSSALIKYNNQEIGYFLSTRDKNMNSRLVITHYALKV